VYIVDIYFKNVHSSLIFLRYSKFKIKRPPWKMKEDGHIGPRAGGPLTVSACDPFLHGNKIV
jgi:hypothetical protein